MANTRLEHEKYDKKASDKSESQRRRREHHKGGEPADWGTVDGDLLVRCVAIVGKAGGAIRLGYSRDGGAFAICIYDNGAGDTEYYPPSTDMIEVLKGVIEDYE